MWLPNVCCNSGHEHEVYRVACNHNSGRHGVHPVSGVHSPWDVSRALRFAPRAPFRLRCQVEGARKRPSLFKGKVFGPGFGCFAPALFRVLHMWSHQAHGVET